MSKKFQLKDGREIDVRPIVADDYEAVMNFLTAISKETIWTNQYPDQAKKDKEKSIKAYQDPNSLFLAAFCDDKVVAVCSIQISHPNHPWIGKNGYFGISILEDYANLGLGKYLMEQLEQWAREKSLHRITGQVRHKNTRAMALYLKCGFEIEGLSREVAFIDGQWHHEYHLGKILD